MLPWSAPWIALTAGMTLALVGWTAFESRAKKVSRLLIQVCVVMLGLRIDLSTLVDAATDGVVFAAATIVGTTLLGLLTGAWLKNDRDTSLLVTSGTAICGGSAIAAVGAAIRASSSQIAVATGAVFLLNALALYLFPIIGHALGMTDAQFGAWAGVAIHDISSVVGAAAKYHATPDSGSEALDTANIVKLSRVIWIVPLAIFAAWMKARHEQGSGGAKVSWRGLVPWFVLLFIVASGVRTAAPAIGDYSGQISLVARTGFQAALFLIGAGLSRAAIAAVGWRTLVQAVILWVAIAGGSLLVILRWY